MLKDFEAIKKAWSKDTAASTTPPDAPSVVGQCAVTALLVQDWYGGDILRAVIRRFNEECECVGQESHYWNRIPGMGEVDLTREQYPGDLQIPRGEVVPRKRLTDGERAVAARTAKRYLKLKEIAEALRKAL